MNKQNRLKNTSRNIGVGLICQCIVLILPFINRTILIYTLGAKFTGLSSLFTSILSVLNIAELGFNAAIIYNMYKPIADTDVNEVKKLLVLYRRIYKIVGIVMLCGGIIILPFIKLLIKGDVPSNINLYVLYLMYLLNSVLSYLLFAYKESILLADQRQDVSSLIRTGITILQYVLQFILLIITKNYYVYMLIAILGTVCTNFMIYYIVNKMYPEYKKIGQQSAKISKKMKKQLGAMLLDRICTVSRNSIDSIIISSFLGLVSVTIYSNYYSIYNSLYTLVLVIGHSMTASIGNSLITESDEKNHQDLEKFSFIHVWIAGWLSICLACLYQPFMKIWMGENLLLSNFNMLLFCIYFYVINMSTIKNQYITASGTQQFYKKGYILQLISNIILNIVLGKYLGITGILLATIFTSLFIDFVYMTKILFKSYFKDFSFGKYMALNVKWMIEVLIIGSFVYWLCNLMHFDPIKQILVNIIICVIIPQILFIFVWYRTDYFKDMIMILKRVLGGR
jgi:O-antigen/teichoic acid export membrane protein